MRIFSLRIFLLFSVSNWYDNVDVGAVAESPQDADSSFPREQTWQLMIRLLVSAHE